MSVQPRSTAEHLTEAFEDFSEFQMKVAQVFTVGIDLENREHVYHAGADEVVVYDGRTLIHREQLNGRLVDEWYAYAAQDCGWLRKGQLAPIGMRVDRSRKTGDE